MLRNFSLVMLMCGIIIMAPLSGCLNDSDDSSSVPDNESNDNENLDNQTSTGNVTDTDNNNSTGIQAPDKGWPFSVEYVNESLVEEDGLILIAKNGGNKIYLINKSGEPLHSWRTDLRLGNDFQLLPNGDLLGLFKPDGEVNNTLDFGGYGGIIAIVGPDSEIKWSYTIASDEERAHHDVEMLPNGNILVMVWNLLNCTLALEMGIDCQADLAYESLYEISTASNSVVWEWRSIDHMVQDRYPEKPNYGNITTNNHRIDFNFNANHPAHGQSGDIMHANGIDYDEENELIYLSVNFYNEVWVIDHSTTIEEAANSSGGNYGVGGDLVYRFGNSTAYQSNESIIFSKNHHPNLIKDQNILGFGNILVFSNGGIDTNNISTIMEISLPVSDYPTMTPPQVVWSYSNEELYSRIISGAERGLNNNTYIAEGDYGVWEVTPSGEVAWKFDFGGTWRAYVYYHGEPEIDNLLS